jgi:hypothetical protein
VLVVVPPVVDEVVPELPPLPPAVVPTMLDPAAPLDVESSPPQACMVA